MVVWTSPAENKPYEPAPGYAGEGKLMRIQVNGREYDVIEDAYLADLLGQVQLKETYFAIAVNQEVVPRSLLDRWQLKEGDCIELVQAVGGG